MANLSFSEVIGGLEQTGDEPGAMRGSAGDNWMQGRTMYGGLSAALCLEAAIRHGNKDGEDLAPLRSAMISFIGPAGAEFTTGAQTLRRGRSVVAVEEGIPDRFWYGSEPKLLVDLRGEAAAALIPRIEAASACYPWADAYTLYPGPNSNSYIQWIALEVPELGLELPWRAIGKNWMRSNYEEVNATC